LDNRILTKQLPSAAIIGINPTRDAAGFRICGGNFGGFVANESANG
jgi:hypothetical protein